MLIASKKRTVFYMKNKKINNSKSKNSNSNV